MKINQLPFLFIFFFLLLSENIILAQLGIKETNTAPNAKAMLDVESANKGILIPRMNTNIRDGIVSPPDGLLIYNNQTKKFNYFDNTAWQEALFGNQWNINGTSISYSGGNVGIGITSPARQLVINGTVNAFQLFQQGAFTGTGSADGLLVGTDINVDGFLWNFESAGLRFGTNNIERLTILSNGNVGIGDNTPSEKLEIAGNIKLSGKVNRDATGTFNLVPIATASIQDNGGLLTGTSNIGTIETVATGHRRITINSATLSIGNNIVVGSALSSFPTVANFLIINGKLEVKTYNLSGTLLNVPFSFVIYSE